MAITYFALGVLLGAFPTDLYKPQVHVVDQKADVDPKSSPLMLRANVTFQNNLKLPVQGVRLGFLLAESDAALKGVDVDRVYEQPPANKPIRGIPFEAAANMGPEATVTSLLSLPMPTLDFSAKVFITHVLGYHLADVDAPTLLNLIASSAPADQVAACEAFGLMGDGQAKARARQRWAKKPELVHELAEVLRAPAPATPQREDTFGRVFAARALGVMGGTEAYEILSQVADDAELAQFDAPVKMLQQARQESLASITPLAFAIPANADTFAAVVAASLQDLGPQVGWRGKWSYGVSTVLGVLAAVAAAVGVGMLRRPKEVASR